MDKNNKHNQEQSEKIYIVSKGYVIKRYFNNIPHPGVPDKLDAEESYQIVDELGSYKEVGNLEQFDYARGVGGDLRYIWKLVKRELFWSYKIPIEEHHTYESKGKTFGFLLFISALTSTAEQRDEMYWHRIEIFELDEEKFGTRRAQILFAKDILESCVPIVKEAMRSRLIKVLTRIGLNVVVKYFFG